MPNDASHFNISRRSLLVGGGAGVGLVLAWGIWPRRYSPNLNAAPGEYIFNAFLKIGTDGHISVVVPQAEMGQGVTTTLPQILADELGADWRTIGVEPAPINPLYANDLLIAENGGGLAALPGGAGDWSLRQIAIRSTVMATMASTSIRGFERRYREAGATARALLCMAAGKHWDADWQACETANGFVVRGNDRLRFAEVAAEAAALKPPADIPLRKPGEGKISGQSVPRIDLPAKVDGSARFAGDVRLPEMAYAAIRHGPFGATHLAGMDKKAGMAVPGMIAVVENPGWVAAVAENSWAANQALDAMKPRFSTTGAFPDDASIDAALKAAFASPKRFIDEGDPDEALSGAGITTAEYRVGLGAHAPIEPLTATARISGDRLEIWMPTQAPELARRAAAKAAGIDLASVTLYPMLVGGGFGRKLATDAAEAAAIIAAQTKRPIQLSWSRAEETMHDSFAPPAIGRMKARLGKGGTLAAWSASIATHSTYAAQMSALAPLLASDEDDPDRAAIEGAVPPYRVPAIAIEHCPVSIGVPTGVTRGRAHRHTAFFTECFIDELARKAGIEPLSYRMQMLGSAPRLARCLTTVATMGNWQGGIEGSGQGIAAHSFIGSHIAMLAEAHLGDGGLIAVDKIVAVIDCGRMIHPDIVRQQIEGGIIWGLSDAIGKAISVKRGLVTARNFNGLGLMTLARTPEIIIEILENQEEPGGVAELAVPVVAPAIANALFTATGKRLRSLPLGEGAPA